MKYKLVIFDMDGTILDTLEDLTASTNYALAENAMPKRTVDEVRRFVGNGILRLIEQAVVPGSFEDEIRRVYTSFTEHYQIHCADRTKPYEGICTLLQELRAQGILTAVVSNKADYGVQSLCKAYFPGLFDYAVGERSGIRRKPAPDTVNEVLRQFRLKPEDAVYIGDSEVDISTAENAGMDLIAVTWGFREEQFLQERGARLFAHTWLELRELLQQGTAGNPAMEAE